MRDMREDLIDMLGGMDGWEIVSVHNTYCGKVRYNGDYIYEMEMFNEFENGRTPLEIASDAAGLDLNDIWIRYNGNGNLESTVCPVDDDWIDIDEIADYIIDNDDALDNDEIREFLIEAYEEEDEEEEEEE